MLTIRYLKSFKQDLKRIKRRGYDLRLLEVTIEMLASGKSLPGRSPRRASQKRLAGAGIKKPAGLKNC